MSTPPDADYHASNLRYLRRVAPALMARGHALIPLHLGVPLTPWRAQPAGQLNAATLAALDESAVRLQAWAKPSAGTETSALPRGLTTALALRLEGELAAVELTGPATALAQTLMFELTRRCGTVHAVAAGHSLRIICRIPRAPQPCFPPCHAATDPTAVCNLTIRRGQAAIAGVAEDGVPYITPAGACSLTALPAAETMTPITLQQLQYLHLSAITALRLVTHAVVLPGGGESITQAALLMAAVRACHQLEPALLALLTCIQRRPALRALLPLPEEVLEFLRDAVTPPQLLTTRFPAQLQEARELAELLPAPDPATLEMILDPCLNALEGYAALCGGAVVQRRLRVQTLSELKEELGQCLQAAMGIWGGGNAAEPARQAPVP